MWRLGVTETDGVYIVFVAGDAQDGLAALDVVDVDAVVTCAGYNFTAVARKANRPDAKVCVEPARGVAIEVREVEKVWL